MKERVGFIRQPYVIQTVESWLERFLDEVWYDCVLFRKPIQERFLEKMPTG